MNKLYLVIDGIIGIGLYLVSLARVDSVPQRLQDGNHCFKIELPDIGVNGTERDEGWYKPGLPYEGWRSSNAVRK